MVKIKRILSFLTAILMVMLAPVTSYASVQKTDLEFASVATDSNYVGIEPYSMRLNNSIAPLSLAGGAMTAVQWLWALILSICGVSVSDLGGLDSITSSIVNWVSKAGQPNEYAQLIMEIEKASWNYKVTHLKAMVSMVKAWLKEQTGYGTDKGMENITVSNNKSFSDSYTTLYGYSRSQISVPDTAVYFASSWRYVTPTGFVYSDYFIDISSKIKFCGVSFGNGITIYTLKNGSLSPDSSFTYEVDYVDKVYLKTSLNGYMRFDEGNYLSFLNACPFPVYVNVAQAESFLKDGMIGTPLNTGYGSALPSISVPVNSSPSIQQKELDSAGDLTIPSGTESGQNVINNANQAVNVDEIIAALKEYVDITYKDRIDEGGKDDTYPWVPDITGAIGAIKDLIYGVKNTLSDISGWVRDIPKTLVDLKNDILTIPHAVADFFSIDYVQVKTSASTLKAALMAKFEPLTAIVGVFQNASASLNSNIPVMTMRVPDHLAPVVGGNEIVVFDLRGYENYVTLFRNLVRCSIWLTFGFTVLGFFRIRFGID